MVYITHLWGGFPSSISRQPRGCQHRKRYVFGKLSAGCIQRRPFGHRHYSKCRGIDHGEPAYRGCVIYTVVHDRINHCKMRRATVGDRGPAMHILANRFVSDGSTSTIVLIVIIVPTIVHGDYFAFLFLSQKSVFGKRYNRGQPLYVGAPEKQWVQTLP